MNPSDRFWSQIPKMGIVIIFSMMSTLFVSNLQVFAHSPTINPMSSDSPDSQTLPTSDWYAWIFVRDVDQLILINEDGQQGAIDRPKLPNEAVESFPQVSISRDSRTAVIQATLSNNNIGVGIYDFAQGRYIKVHEAQVGEQVTFVTNGLNFDPDSEKVAVTFANFNDFDNRTWRIIIFETATGNAVATLDNASPLLSLDPNQLMFPLVPYFDEGGAVHVQVLPYATEPPQNVPAFIWYSEPPNIRIEPSPYTRLESDILPTTGEAVFAGVDDSESVLPQTSPAPSYNAILRGLPATATTTVWSDGTRFHFNARWAANGQLILFQTSTDVENFQHIVYNVDTNGVFILPSNIIQTYGTPTDFISRTETGVELHSADNPIIGQPLWEAESGSPFQIIWASPAGSTFELEALSGAPPVVNNVAVVHCDGAPISTLAVGMRGRVTFNAGDPRPLRLRQTPNGTQITSMAEGTPFDVVGGPQCSAGYTWWQLQLDDGRSGWAAEGDRNLYFMEPLPAGGEGDALVNTNRLNIRSQPGTGGAILDVALRGQSVEVMGRLSDNSWIQVRTLSGVQGWVTRQFLDLSISLDTVPIVNALIINPPTPAPSSEVVFTADRQTINPTECITLLWNVLNASQVTLQGTTVAASGTQLQCPIATTTYQLVVTSLGGTVTPYNLTITVTSGY